MADNLFPEDAFLVIEGGTAVPLNRDNITIGRRHDNDIVLDDPRVSRHHAKISFIHEHFVLIDLNSSGGSFINGRRASHEVLYPGDLISFAGLNLVFMQNSVLKKRTTDPLAPPGPGERNTAIFNSSDFEDGKYSYKKR